MDFGEGSCSMNLGNKISKRSSTRVNQAPGGTDSVIIGGPEPVRQSRATPCPPASNPINWGQLEAAPKSSSAVARAGAEDRMKNSPFATAPTAQTATVPSVMLGAPYASTHQRPTTPYATGDNVENVPPAARTGRKLMGGYAKDTDDLLAWKPATAAEKAAEVAEIASRSDRVCGGGRTSITLGGADKPVPQSSGRVPPGGQSSFNLRHD